MDKAAIKTFVTELLDGFELGGTLFDNYLDMAQALWEGKRPWVQLRTEDSSKTVLSADTFLTAKALPTNFRRFYSTTPIVLVDAQSNPTNYLKNIPLEEKLRYQNDGGKFYIDLVAGNFFICGTHSGSLTAHLYYIARGTSVSAADANLWIFPTEYHGVLGLTIAAWYKYGIDYDIINAVQADEQTQQAQLLFKQMEDWDDELALSAAQGRDLSSGPGGFKTQLGGTLPL